MKRILLLTAGFVCFPLLADDVRWHDQFVQIYAEADAAAYGRTVSREEVLSQDVYNFTFGRTLWVGQGKGYLTAVTASAAVKEDLDALLAQERIVKVKGRELYRVETDHAGAPLAQPFYAYKERERGILIGFSLEKAPQAMLDLIGQVYKLEPKVAATVKAHYQNNYVIRIYQADNLYSKADPPSIHDIMLNATLLGEKFQNLIGIHDGQDFLADLAAFYRSKRDYSVLTDDFNPYLEP